MYNSKIQKQNKILAAVAISIGYYHELAESHPSLREYDEELSRYVWTLNMLDLKKMIN